MAMLPRLALVANPTGGLVGAPSMPHQINQYQFLETRRA